MKLEDALNQQVKMISIRDVICPDRTCDNYGKINRCYLKPYNENCKDFMRSYMEKRKNGKTN
jgi:hypothetical protein